MNTAELSPATAFHLLSTTRYDDALLGHDYNTAVNSGEPSPFLLLRYHFDRLVTAAERHGWWSGADGKLLFLDLLRECEAAVRKARDDHSSPGPFRVCRKICRKYRTLIERFARYE